MRKSRINRSFQKGSLPSHTAEGSERSCRMINVTICGAAGRMGRINIAVFSENEDMRIIGAIEAANSPAIGLDSGEVAGIGNIGVPITADFRSIVERTDVVVDFTNPAAALDKIDSAKDNKKAFVIGTTGFTDRQHESIRTYAEQMPILLSPNMSLGINTLFYLVKRAAEILGNGYDAEILEIHHNLKKDAPSGTALQFGRVIAAARDVTLDDVAVYGRQGQVGIRKDGEIGIMALRAADIVGDHTVLFAGPGERIELIHRNSSRRTYASGAMRAARFIVQKKTGLFSMSDVLELK